MKAYTEKFKGKKKKQLFPLILAHGRTLNKVWQYLGDYQNFSAQDRHTIKSNLQY